MVRPLQFTSRVLLILPILLSSALSAGAQERLCDTQFEDCRTPILDLIRNETVGIDVAFWFMEDARYANELISRHRAGVPVRVLIDQRANKSKRLNELMLTTLRDAGIPMRDKYVQDILHFKMMLFHGQNVVEFGKGNYNATAFVAIEPNVNYDDEAVFFTNDNNLTNTFRRKFDDLWTDTARFRDYANIVGPPVRKYPLYPLHPSMNFPPFENFSTRSVSRYNAEPTAIDAMVFRVTDHRQADAMIRAEARGVPVRLITEPTEYRNPARVWDAKHVDRMWMGGVDIKMRKHEGLMHEAAVVMHGLGEVIFGSANWTTASAEYQDEHNYFYNPTLGKPWFFDWFVNQFNHKWNDTTNYVPFQPLPPDTPAYVSPANGVAGLGSTVTLRWDGGPWAHLYDISVGTDPFNLQPLVTSRELGSPLEGQHESYALTNLLPGTTYYWRVVSKTWAQIGKAGPVWSFTTAGTAPAPKPGEDTVKINFQPSWAAVPAGYLPDAGLVFADRGNGRVYGWDVDNTAQMRERGATEDQRLDTVAYMQKAGTPNASWEIALPGGTYRVRVVAGDPSYFGNTIAIAAEGTLTVSGLTSSAERWLDGTSTVTVEDGRLTISSAAGADGNKICFIEITPQVSTPPPPPPVSSVSINFQPAGAPVPSGYLPDTGLPFADRGNGRVYGWNADNTAQARDRNVMDDQRFDTLMYMQRGENPDASWEIALPNGTYTVRVVAGDPSFFNKLALAAEGTLIVSGTTTSDARWLTGQSTVTVNDGRLTITNAPGAEGNKICFIEITPVTPQ